MNKAISRLGLFAVLVLFSLGAAAQEPDSQNAAAVVPGPTVIDVANKLPKAFRLIEVSIVLDAAEVAHWKSPDGKDLPKSLRVYEAPLRPGLHAMTAHLTYSGRNRGPFTYMDAYQFSVRAEHTFSVEAGKATAVSVVAAARPGANIPMEKKPYIDFLAQPSAGPIQAPVPPLPSAEPRPDEE